MKKILFLVLISFSASNLSAQKVAPKSASKTKTEVTTKKTIKQMKKALNDSINKWSFEVMVGQSKGVRPYADGYYSSNPNRFFGEVAINSYEIGARYMFTPKYGLKLDFTYDKLSNVNTNNLSKPFEMLQYRMSFQGVVNARNLFDLEPVAHRWGLLIHGGFQIANKTSKTENILPYLADGVTSNPNYDSVNLDNNNHHYNGSEWDGGLIVGFTPQFRISNSLALMLDVSSVSNYRQHMNWDGTHSKSSNNLSGQLVSTSIGLSYSFGSDKMHGDFSEAPDLNAIENERLEKKLGEIETSMNDSDKDGVPDYLDKEPNSVAGVEVNTKGQMIDLNKNNIPDELETYINNAIQEGNKTTIVNNNANEAIDFKSDAAKKLINENYKAAYFEFAIDKPTNVSSEGIGFVLSYLRANPNDSVEMTGHADEIGSTKYNLALAKRRAESIKSVLIKSGINGNRIKITASGIDKTVDKKSKEARRLVRRVTFKIVSK